MKWTEQMKDFVRKNCHCMKDKEIAAYLTIELGVEVKRDSVTQQRQMMGMRKKSGRGVCEVIRKGVARATVKPKGVALYLKVDPNIDEGGV